LEEPEGFTAVLEKEGYSTLLRGLALLLALEQLLVYPPKRDAQPRIYQALSPDKSADGAASNRSFVEGRASQPWLDLVEVYRLAYRIQAIRVDLNGFIKQLKVIKPEQLTYKLFRDWWNGKQLNRLEYYLSAMERLVYNNNLLMRDENELPNIFRDAVSSLKTRVSEIKQEVNDLNHPADCVYLHALLKVPIEQALLPNHVRANIISFTPQQLKMYDQETLTTRTGIFHPKYKAVVFPKVGYSFSRNGSPYKPDAYSHGGISIQELMIPMVVMKVKTREKGLLTLDPISGPNEALEGEEVVFRLQLHRTASHKDDEDLAVEVEATCTSLEVGEETSRYEDAQPLNLPRQLLYISSQSTERPTERPAEVIYRFKPGREQATLSELQHERMKRLLTITISYREGRRTIRKSQSLRFTVLLKSDRVIRRVPSSLGSIMGLTPRQRN
jgi:hypothetical protein